MENPDWNAQCDAGQCPATVKGYYSHKNLILGFCQHHFFENELQLIERGWQIAAKDGILIREVKEEKV